MTANHARVEWLDSVRGLAALVVLFSHSMGVLTAPSWFYSLVNLPIIRATHDGLTAVAMFFLLSGFVLALPYARPQEDGRFRAIGLPSFFFRRFMRIWVPWFAVFCASAVAMSTIFRQYPTNPAVTDWASVFWQEPLNLRTMAQQMIFTFHEPLGALLVPQDWSLGVELRASAILPLLVVVLRKSTLALAVLGLLMFLHQTGYYYATFTAGVILARHHTELGAWFSRRSRVIKWAILVSAIALCDARSFVGGSERYIWSLTAIGCLLLLVAGLGSRRLAEALSRPSLVFIGRISYSIYLTHFVVLLCCVPPVIHLANKAGVTNSTVAYFLSIVVAWAVTIPLSIASYRWIEVPAIELGRAVLARRKPCLQALPSN